MGFKMRIARKKARAIIKIAFYIAVLVDLNGFIEYLKALPEPTDGVMVFVNTPLVRAESGQNQPSLTDSAPKEAVEPEKGEGSLEANFSAYTASVDETDSRPREMASGKEVYEGAIACPDALIFKDGKRVFGTKIKIEGLGVFTCEDRMHERYRGKAHFDIYMETKKEAFEFGRRTLAYSIVD